MVNKATDSEQQSREKEGGLVITIQLLNGNLHLHLRTMVTVTVTVIGNKNDPYVDRAEATLADKKCSAEAASGVVEVPRL